MGRFFIVSGHSGCGKTSVMRETGLIEIVSCTTRERRTGEIDGTDYFFLEREEFDFYVKNNEFAEHITYGTGDSYGVWEEEIESKLKRGDCYIIAEHNGMLQLKQRYPEAITIFMYTPKLDSMINMANRGDKTDSVLKRLDLYDGAMATRFDYDYVIRNNRGGFDQTVALVKAIVNANQGTMPLLK